MRDLATILIPIGTVAGFIAYVLLRLMYTRYLSEFNLRPEDLGLGYLEVITSSLGAVVVGLGFPLLIARGAISIVGDERQRWPGLLVVALGLTVTALVPSHSALRALGIVTLVAILWSVVPIPRVPRPPRDLSLRALVIVTAVLATTAMAVTVLRAAEISGRAARFGVATKEVTALGLPFIGFKPTAVHLKWTDQRPNASLPICPMYIGQHEGTLYVFDVLEQETVRIPASRVVALVPPRPRDQDPSDCLRKSLEATFGTKNEQIRRCLQKDVSAPNSSSQKNQTQQCFRQQLERNFRNFKDERLGRCLGRSLRDNRIALNQRQARQCWIGFAEREVRRRTGVQTTNELRLCLRNAILLHPLRVDGKFVARCVSDAISEKLRP